MYPDGTTVDPGMVRQAIETYGVGSIYNHYYFVSSRGTGNLFITKHRHEFELTDALRSKRMDCGRVAQFHGHVTRRSKLDAQQDSAHIRRRRHQRRIFREKCHDIPARKFKLGQLELPGKLAKSQGINLFSP